MRKDMELIKKILLKLEEKESPVEYTGPDAIDGYDPEIVSWHYEMMAKADLIIARKSGVIGTYRWDAQRLTWPGCDFLDAARNDKIWNKAKEIIKKHGGIFSIEVLKPLFIKLALQQLKNAGYL